MTNAKNKTVSTPTTSSVEHVVATRIIALAERWVFMGDFHAAGAKTPAYMTDASCIRKWGTTAGLGEIALNGPTSETVLDACGILVMDNPAAVLFTIPFAGTVEHAKFTAAAGPTAANPVPDRRIIALAERWVFMGNYHAATATTPAFMTDASCVRKWGTTAGLGEIALNGPTGETVLDACGVLVLDNPAAVLFTVKCSYA